MINPKRISRYRSRRYKVNLYDQLFSTLINARLVNNLLLFIELSQNQFLIMSLNCDYILIFVNVQSPDKMVSKSWYRDVDENHWYTPWHTSKPIYRFWNSLTYLFTKERNFMLLWRHQSQTIIYICQCLQQNHFFLRLVLVIVNF